MYTYWTEALHVGLHCMGVARTKMGGARCLHGYSRQQVYRLRFQCTTLSNTNEHLPSAEDNGKSLGISTPGTPMDSRPPVVRVWPIEILLPRFSEHVQVPVFSCLMDRVHWVSCQRHVYLFQVVYLSIVFVAQLWAITYRFEANAPLQRKSGKPQRRGIRWMSIFYLSVTGVVDEWISG